MGICLGMQLLATYGTEGAIDDQKEKGLDLIPGMVKKMEGNIRLPHVGWNEINIESEITRF